MFVLRVLDVTQILLWKVSGFLVSKQSTFLTYFQSSKHTEAKHSHIMHVRNTLKYFSISCAQCECLINQRDYENEQNKLKNESPLKTTTTGIIQTIPYHVYVDKKEEYTHEYLITKAKPYNFVHYCQRSFTSLFVS